MADENDTWLPKTREDWTDMFADGLAKHQSRMEEAEAKRKADEGENSGGDNDPPRKSLAERLLGG